MLTFSSKPSHKILNYKRVKYNNYRGKVIFQPKKIVNKLSSTPKQPLHSAIRLIKASQSNKDDFKLDKEF